MENKIVLILLILSIAVNFFILGKQLLVDHWYDPSSAEEIILSEMIQKTVESEDYKAIATKENVIAIEGGLDKNKGGVFPYYFGVSVRTDKQTHIFSCINERCSKMKSGETTYSIYEDEKPRLPFAEKDTNR